MNPAQAFQLRSQLDELKKENGELRALLSECNPIISRMIGLTPTGTERNLYCDTGIKVVAALSAKH